jgi:hypothetical protein
VTKAKVNYGRVNVSGSVVLAMFFSLLPALLVYRITGMKVWTVLCFFPTVILLTRVLLWTQKRVFKEDADTFRRRYRAGSIPVGKEK